MPLIVLEGPEGAGKTTQIALLAKRLGAGGKRVVTLREPGGTDLGDIIREQVLHSAAVFSAEAESLLFMASRAQLVRERIRPELEAGAVVLLDRFFLSTYAYQGAGRGVSIDLIVEANRLAADGLTPDLTVLLAFSAEAGLARAARRGKPDRIERADAAFHQRVAAAFAEFATPAWQARHPEAGRVVTVDGGGSVDEVQERVVAAVRHNLPTVATRAR